jgi:hypothetical protein
MLTPTLGEILDNQQMDPTDSQLWLWMDPSFLCASMWLQTV